MIANKTLVLDLDETLIHSVDDGHPADLYLTIKPPNGCTISVDFSFL